VPQKPDLTFHGDDYHDEQDRGRQMAELITRWTQGRVPATTTSPLGQAAANLAAELERRRQKRERAMEQVRAILEVARRLEGRDRALTRKSRARTSSK
jgi:hypothetical protein